MGHDHQTSETSHLDFPRPASFRRRWPTADSSFVAKSRLPLRKRPPGINRGDGGVGGVGEYCFCLDFAGFKEAMCANFIYSHRSRCATVLLIPRLPMSLPFKFHNSGWLWWASASALPAQLILFCFFLFPPNLGKLCLKEFRDSIAVIDHQNKGLA